MSSNTNSMPRTSSASSLSAVGEVLEHVALGRAVGVVEDARERLGAAGRRRTPARATAVELVAHAPPRPARSPAGSSRPCARSAARCRAAGARAGARARRAASVVCRLASTSAIVCGDSLRSSAAIRSGGTRRRNSNGRVSAPAGEPAEQLGRALGPERALDHLAREVQAAGDAAAVAPGRRGQLARRPSRSSRRRPG